MPVTLGINGFGRIGRYLLRLLANDEEIRFSAINARAGNDALAYLLKYDSTYGVFPGEVGHDENGIIVNGRHIAVTRCQVGQWEWGASAWTWWWRAPAPSRTGRALRDIWNAAPKR